MQQVSELRSLLQGGEEEDEEEDEEEEEEGGGRGDAGGGRPGASEMMVFEADEEGQPAYEPPPTKEVPISDVKYEGRLQYMLLQIPQRFYSTPALQVV